MTTEKSRDTERWNRVNNKDRYKEEKYRYIENYNYWEEIPAFPSST